MSGRDAVPAVPPAVRPAAVGAAGGGPGRGRRRAPGLTLVEVLVALAVLAIALLVWVRLDGSLAHVDRASRERRALARAMRNELRLQRNVRAFACIGEAPRRDWSCEVERSCLRGATACELDRVRVAMKPPTGPGLVGITVVWWPLQRATVAGAGP